jgi:hypothetical protein
MTLENAQAAAQIVIGAAITLIALLGVLSLIFSRVRTFIFRRIAGWIYREVTALARSDRFEAEERQRRRQLVLEAVGVLEDGLSRGIRDDIGRKQISQALSVFELYGPEELKALGIAALAEAQVSDDGGPVEIGNQRHVMSPITAAVRRWDAETRP